MAIKNDSIDRKVRVYDSIVRKNGVMNPIEFLRFIEKRNDGVRGLSLTCAGILPSGEECGCPMHFCFGDEKAPYFAVDKKFEHKANCPNANPYLATVCKELSRNITYNVEEFFDELIALEDKTSLPTDRFEEDMPFPGNMVDPKSAINPVGRADADIVSGFGERVERDPSNFTSSRDPEPMQFDFGKRKEEFLAEHRRIYRTMVRKPRVPLELYIQMRKYADLNDTIVGSDIIKYKDILFCCETKNAFRKKAGMFKGKVIPVFARKGLSALWTSINNDEKLQNAMNPGNLPFSVMTDSYFVTREAKDENEIYHNEERVIFFITFASEAIAKEFQKEFEKKKPKVKGKKVPKNYNWKKKYLLFFRWEEEYNDFIDSDGYRRKVVKGHCVSFDKQIKRVENSVFNELEGEYIKSK